MPKKALILVAEGHQDEEFLYPYYRLKEEGWLVDVYPGGKGKYGIPAKPEGGIALNAWDLPWECVIMPGGWQSPEIVRQMPEALSIIKAMNKLNRCVAAICHGPLVLISAGIMQGVSATCYKGMKDDLVNAHAVWVDEPVVEFSNIVTAQHYRDCGRFMRAVFRTIERLASQPFLIQAHAI